MSVCGLLSVSLQQQQKASHIFRQSSCQAEIQQVHLAPKPPAPGCSDQESAPAGFLPAEQLVESHKQTLPKGKERRRKVVDLIGLGGGDGGSQGQFSYKADLQTFRSISGAGQGACPATMCMKQRESLKTAIAKQIMQLFPAQVNGT